MAVPCISEDGRDGRDGREGRPVGGLVALVLAGCLAGSAVSAQENLAAGHPVASSGPNWGSFKPESLTDGDPATFTHPLGATGTEGFYYEVDLGRVVRLERIVLRNRSDGCCPERLSNFRVEVYGEGDDGPGERTWWARLRADGSNSGVGGVDTILAAADPTGAFAGRYVRVVNHGGAAYSPQLAEIEVYGGQPPVIVRFEADLDVLDSGEGTVLRWETRNAESVNLASGTEPGPGVPVPAADSRAIGPATTTTYTLTAANGNGAVTARLTVGVGVTLGPPDLTEFQADNTAGWKDRDGEGADWIELHNPNSYGLNLAGYALTDDPAVPAKWILPAVRVPAGGYRVVFASGKDRRDPAGELHTNFRLDADGEYLALVARDGSTVLRRFPADYPRTATFGPQVGNSSQGVGPDGRSGFFRPPTPGEANGAAYAGVVADTKFDRDRGLYEAEFRVTLSTATPGATIRYTTNRTEPTSTRGTVYTGPIPIRSTTVLRAAAFREGWAPTDVDTHTYVFPAQVIGSSVMRRQITTNAVYGPQLPAALRDVPSVSLVTSGTVNDTTEVGVSVEWLAADGVRGVQANAGVRWYGGAFSDFAKKNFRLYFRSVYGPRRLGYPVFAGFERGRAAVDEFDQLELRGGSHDMAQRGFYLGNVFADDTLLEMGHLNPHGRFVHLYLNGTYWGLYHLRERWGAAMHERYLGGSRGDYESINGNWNVGGWAEPGVPYDGDGSTWARVKSLRADYAAVRGWVDVPQFVDYMLMWMFGGAEDEYRCVGPTVPGSGFQFQLNDADGWFCLPAYCEAGNRTGRGAPGRAAGDGPGSLFSMLYRGGDPDYRVLLADRIQRALSGEGALTPARNTARLDARSREMERAFLAEAARWGFLSPAEWRARRDYARTNWFPRRTEEVRAQFRSAGFLPSLEAPVLDLPAVGVPPGTRLRFRGPATGTVWFTTDGTDPRLPGGGVSATARGHRSGGRSETVVPAGSRWRWFSSAAGLEPSTSAIVEGHPGWSAADWKHFDFDDRGWAEGAAQLGYGEGDEATVIPFGGATGNKWITAYFRHRFRIADAGSIRGATLRLRRDDGAIVYVNGREVARSSIGAGTVNASTLADGAPDDGQDFGDIAIGIEPLREGDNQIAVELHQATPASSDASFDLELILTRADTGASGELPWLTGNTWVRCRTQEGGQWSGLVEAFVEVAPPVPGPGDVVLSEVHYHPAGPEGAEFLEIANLSAQAVNLRGARFVEGIAFAFPEDRDVVLASGERRVLVNDLFRFRREHGGDLPVDGIYAGALANEGERLTLVNAAGEVVTTVAYGPGAPWPDSAAGGGRSLVLAHPGRGPENPAAWRISAVTNGTPRGVDTVAFAGAADADEDGDGLPALVEYALGTSDRDAASGPDAFGFERTESQWLTVVFTRELSADDVVLEVGFSRDLKSWSPATFLAARLGGNGRLRETWGIPMTALDRGFLRVRAVR